MVATYLEDVLGTTGILFLYEIRLHKRSTSMPYKISFVISIGGIILAIIACQLIILIKILLKRCIIGSHLQDIIAASVFLKNKH